MARQPSQSWHRPFGVALLMRVAIFASLLLTACASTSPQQFVGPSGRPAYALRCGSNLAACYTRAGELCTNGYLVIDRATGTVAIPAGNSVPLGEPRQSLGLE